MAYSLRILTSEYSPLLAVFSASDVKYSKAFSALSADIKASSFPSRKELKTGFAIIPVPLHSKAYLQLTTTLV